MDFCQIMTFTPAEQLVELAQVAEDVGFASIAFSDHVVYPLGMTSAYPYAADGMPGYTPESPWLDPLVAIGACATATRALRFYTNIYVLPYRNPFVAAKAAATAAYLTGDRLHFGVGAGWMREEFELLGQAFDRRGARMVEAVEILRRLWAGGPVEHHGEFYDFGPAQMSPPPAEPIPVLIGGHTELAMTRAAAIGDGWLGVDYTPDDLRPILHTLRQLRSEAGRSELPFEIVTGLRAKPEPDLVAELEELGVTTILTSAIGFGHTDPNDRAGNRAALAAYAKRFIEPLAT